MSSSLPGNKLGGDLVLIAYLFILFIILSFFLGRAYEFFTNNKRTYAKNWLQYQSGLLYKCTKENQEKGRTLDPFFINNGYKKIVIYAVGIYYNPLIESIDKKYFEEIYVADANSIQLSKELGQKVYAKEELPELLFDVIIVTSVAHFQEIAKELRQLVYCIIDI